MDGDDIQLVLKQNISYFSTYEIYPSNYSLKDVSEVFSRGFRIEFEVRGRNRPNFKNDKSRSIIPECDNIATRTKLIVKAGFLALRFG